MRPNQAFPILTLAATALAALPSAYAATPAASSPASPAAQASSAKLDHADRKFVLEAAKGGMAEVALGKLAEQRAESGAVKKFGARMVEDHGKADDELKQLASSKGIALPAEAAPDKHMRRLEGQQGAAFDREYMSYMVSEHRKDVSTFEKEAKSARDPQVRAFASNTLPTLKSHLQMAEQTRNDVKSEQSSESESAGRSTSAAMAGPAPAAH